MAEVAAPCSVAERGSTGLMGAFVLPEMQEKSPQPSVKQSKPKHFQVS